MPNNNRNIRESSMSFAQTPEKYKYLTTKASIDIQLLLHLAIQYPMVYGSAWVRSNSDQAKNSKQLRKIIEYAVIFFAGFINPEAANWAIPFLKLCFMILNYLQKR